MSCTSLTLVIQDASSFHELLLDLSFLHKKEKKLLSTMLPKVPFNTDSAGYITFSYIVKVSFQVAINCHFVITICLNVINTANLLTEYQAHSDTKQNPIN
jgi:hypothetical protein